MARGMPLAHHEDSRGRLSCEGAGFHYSGDDELAEYEAPAQQQLHRDPKDEEPAAWLVFNESGNEKYAFSSSQLSQLQHILRQCRRSDAGSDARSRNGQSVAEVTAVTERTDDLSLTQGRKRPLPQEDESAACPSAPRPSQSVKNLTRRARTSTSSNASKRSSSSLQHTCPHADLDSRPTPAHTPAVNALEHKRHETQPRTFHVGDLRAVENYMAERLKELTLKPAREILTSWIHLVEPRRSSLYGSYTKIAPKDDPRCEALVDASRRQYPPWWPENVMYWQPSHLSSDDTVALFIHILLLHRMPMADGRPRVNWVKRLRERAIRIIENNIDEHFASGKLPAYNVRMKERALTEILPDLFDLAQKYEDHFAQYGSDEDAISISVTHTWHPASARPKFLSRVEPAARKTEAPAPRKRRALEAPPPPKPDARFDVGSDTEVDTDVENEQSQVSSRSVRSMKTVTRSPTVPIVAPAALHHRPQPLEMTDSKPSMQASPPMTAMPSPMDFQVGPPLPPPQSHNSPFIHFAQVQQPTFQPTMNTAWSMPQMGVGHSQSTVPSLYPSPIFNETIRPMRPAETMAIAHDPFPFRLDDSSSSFTTSFGSTMSFDDEEPDSNTSAYPTLSSSYVHF